MEVSQRVVATFGVQDMVLRRTWVVMLRFHAFHMRRERWMLPARNRVSDGLAGEGKSDTLPFFTFDIEIRGEWQEWRAICGH